MGEILNMVNSGASAAEIAQVVKGSAGVSKSAPKTAAEIGYRMLEQDMAPTPQTPAQELRTLYMTGVVTEEMYADIYAALGEPAATAPQTTTPPMQ